MNQPDYEFLVEVLEFVEKAGSHGLDDRGLASRFRAWLKNTPLTNHILTWKTNVDHPLIERARHKNTRFYLFHQPYFGETFYQCVATDGEDLVWSEGGTRRDQVKDEALAFIKRMGNTDVKPTIDTGRPQRT